jgi:SAM-dependent methyltransferase
VTETSFESTYALDGTHPNHHRWQRAIDRARLRGETVCDALALGLDLSGAVVLDAGCGVGGTSAVLHARGADVIAIDCDAARLAAVKLAIPGIDVEQADLEELPFPDDSFDAIVMQDVIEHVAAPTEVLAEITRVLAPGGVLYLSTPNRRALTNIVSDPHFGLPFVSLYSRRKLREVLRRKRPADAERPDLAQLLSFDELQALLRVNGLRPTFHNRFMARRLFEQPESLVWADAHLRVVSLLRRVGLHRVAEKFVSDEPGFFNAWLNPSWYVLCRKDAL